MKTSNQPNHSKKTHRKYTRRTDKQWQELVNNFNQSDLSLEAYCKQHNIAPSGFYTWRKRVEEQSKQKLSTDPLIDLTSTFQQNPIKTDLSSNQWDVELELGTHCLLRIKMT